MNIHPLLEALIRPFRLRRMKRFLAFLGDPACSRILDVGGTPFNWTLVDYPGEVVLLNVSLPKSTSAPANFSFVTGDGCALDYPDRSFDMVFCNSVIEHVGSWARQQQFASELLRVGKRVWLQTPAKTFPFEPHYLTPFVHYLPKSLQKKLLRNFSVWGWLVRPPQSYVDAMVDSTTLLGYAELRTLFPGCEISRERFLFMTKSYLVTRD